MQTNIVHGDQLKRTWQTQRLKYLVRLSIKSSHLIKVNSKVNSTHLKTKNPVQGFMTPTMATVHTKHT